MMGRMIRLWDPDILENVLSVVLNFKFKMEWFFFPSVYNEMVQKAQNGELGKEIQTFFAEHEDGAIDAEYVTLCCEDCGNLSKGKNMTMYVPVEQKPESFEHRAWSVAFDFEGADYVTKSDLEEYYQEYAKYPHRCDKCGGTMKIMDKVEEKLCPKCKVPLEITNIMMWD